MTDAPRRGVFDALASRWDDMRPAGAQDEVVLRGLVLVGPLEGRVVVDLGCGTGLLEGHLLQRIGEGRIIAIDSSPAMIERARSKHPDGSITWLCEDALAATVAPASVDAVLCYNTWPHFDDWAAVAGRIARWLRPHSPVLVWHDIGRERLASIHSQAGGAIAGDHLPPVEELAAVFASAGLEIERAEEDVDSYTLLGRRCDDPA